MSNKDKIAPAGTEKPEGKAKSAGQFTLLWYLPDTGGQFSGAKMEENSQKSAEQPEKPDAKSQRGGPF